MEIKIRFLLEYGRLMGNYNQGAIICRMAALKRYYKDAGIIDMEFKNIFLMTRDYDQEIYYSMISSRNHIDIIISISQMI